MSFSREGDDGAERVQRWVLQEKLELTLKEKEQAMQYGQSLIKDMQLLQQKLDDLKTSHEKTKLDLDAAKYDLLTLTRKTYWLV